jgi:hypothetical protein
MEVLVLETEPNAAHKVVEELSDRVRGRLGSDAIASPVNHGRGCG